MPEGNYVFVIIMPFDYSYQTSAYMEIIFLVTSTKMYLNFKVIILSERKQISGCLWTMKGAWIAKGHQETFQGCGDGLTKAGLKLSFQKLRSWHPVSSLHVK